jgi:hypothetical protein
MKNFDSIVMAMIAGVIVVVFLMGVSKLATDIAEVNSKVDSLLIMTLPTLEPTPTPEATPSGEPEAN